MTLVTLIGWSPAPARADGDPASDVLASQPLFLPQDAAAGARQQADLDALLNEAGRGGVQLRVALIASPTDLGSVTELWRQPRNYARFLGQELSLVYRGPVLVVMPGGLGLYQAARSTAAAQSALAGVAPAGSSARLTAVALVAIRRLAAAAGHPLAVPAGARPASPSPTATASWVAFSIGAALIVLAWTLSLRARPPRLRSGRIESA